MTETELMPRMVVGNTELGGSKLKKGKGFSKPNLERVPNWSCLAVRFDRFVGSIDAKYPDQLGFSAVNVSFSQERS